jgi:hypothetical protein
MENINWKELFSNEMNVFHCETEDLANHLLSIAHNLGYQWVLSASYLEKNNWNKYKEETCYEIYSGHFSRREFFRREGYTIINTNELIGNIRKPFKLHR